MLEDPVVPAVGDLIYYELTDLGELLPSNIGMITAIVKERRGFNSASPTDIYYVDWMGGGNEADEYGRYELPFVARWRKQFINLAENLK